MVLSKSSGKHGILQRATFLVFGDSLDHTADYPLADMVASANTWLQHIATWIWRASGTWEFDDSNQSDLPSATATLVNGQQDYTLPTTLLALRRVEVKDSGGNWVKLRQLDQTEVDVALPEYEKTSGLPHSFDVRGNSLFLYPAPASGSVTLASGITIYFDREVTTFSVPVSYTTDDATEPGFAEAFHDLVCYGIAHDYLIANNQSKADNYWQKMQVMRNDLAASYGARNKSKKVAITPSAMRYQRDWK